MTEALLELLPDSPVYHVGMYRNPGSNIPVQYYNRLPKGHPSDVAFVLDPVIASCELVCFVSGLGFGFVLVLVLVLFLLVCLGNIHVHCSTTIDCPRDVRQALPSCWTQSPPRVSFFIPIRFTLKVPLVGGFTLRGLLLALQFKRIPFPSGPKSLGVAGAVVDIYFRCFAS